MKECTVINIELNGTLEDLHSQKELFLEYVNPIFGDALILVKHTPLYTFDNPQTLSKAIDYELTLKHRANNNDNNQLFDNTLQATQLSIFLAIIRDKSTEKEDYIDLLNHLIARTIAVYGLKAENEFDNGVLVGGKNISILYSDFIFSEEGFGVTLNVNTDIDGLEKIKLSQNRYQSLKNILGYEVEMDDIVDLIIINFGKIFNYKMTLPKTYSQLV